MDEALSIQSCPYLLLRFPFYGFRALSPMHPCCISSYGVSAAPSHSLMWISVQARQSRAPRPTTSTACPGHWICCDSARSSVIVLSMLSRRTGNCHSGTLSPALILHSVRQGPGVSRAREYGGGCGGAGQGEGEADWMARSSSSYSL